MWESFNIISFTLIVTYVFKRYVWSHFQYHFAMWTTRRLLKKILKANHQHPLTDEIVSELNKAIRLTKEAQKEKKWFDEDEG